MLETLGAPERRRLLAKRKRDAPPEPDPTPVPTSRATIIDVDEPLTSDAAARQWLNSAGEDQLQGDLAVLNRALHSFRLVIADPYAQPVGRRHALVARIGYGDGEQVSDGQWTAARELDADPRRQPRAKVLTPQARFAAVLGGRERALACEELALRARSDVDAGREREAALQALVALDAALAELQADPTAEALAKRLDELRGLRESIAAAAQAALAGALSSEQFDAVKHALSRIEAALRARAVVNA